MIERDSMAFDVLIIGAGPAGLSTAIRLAQLDSSLRICVLDKAADIGGQILSGAVLEPRALQELLPNWQAEQAPLNTLATQDNFLFLTENKSYQLPTPPQMKNHGNYIISLGKFCQWLANIAENLGVNIFPGFAATEMIYHHHIVRGVITGDKGLNKAGKPGANFQPGMALYAKQTILAEGCRGSLTQTVIAQYALNKDSNPQLMVWG